MIWFTADTHFGHAGILTHQLKRAAEFESVEAMDCALIDGINAVVGRNDELWHLGDFGWGAQKYGHYRQRLRVRKLQVLRGNHDRPSLRKHVSSMEMMVLRTFQDIKFILCHYPIYSWAGRCRGSVHLYGHCHDMAEARLDEIMPCRRSMDVGIDNAYRLLGEWRPFSIDEIITLLKADEPVNDNLHRAWSDASNCE
jgi:calcineurin-like phosphoesterase family protein